MKKYFLAASMLLFTCFSVFAQNEEEHSAAYNWGKRNAIPVVIGVIVVIILAVWAIRRKKKSA